MARKRIIDPNFWRDEKIAKCSYMERLLFQGLWTFAEDSGVGRASPLLIKADVFPYDTLREADIEKSLAKLASLSLITLYEIAGQRYYHVINFKKHQVINKPSQCYLPLPDCYGSSAVVVTPEDNISEEEDNIREGEPEIPEHEKNISDVIDYLNQKTGKKYDGNISKNREHISGRLNEGRTVAECRYAIDVKCEEWLGTDFEKNLNPVTLFRPSNFDRYINQKPKARAD